MRVVQATFWHTRSSLILILFPFFHHVQQYHNTDTYLISIAKGCTSECAYKQYEQCGNGFTAEDEALFSSPALTDPVQSLTPEAAQQVFTQSGSPSPVAPANQNSSSKTVRVAGVTVAFAFLSAFVL